MLQVLTQLPAGTKELKETIVAHLGMLGQMSATRDINAVWNETKKKAVKEYPQIFVLGPRGVLQWNDGSQRVLDKTISTANFKKLNDLADTEGCTVDQIVTGLLRYYEKAKNTSGAEDVSCRKVTIKQKEKTSR